MSRANFENVVKSIVHRKRKEQFMKKVEDWAETEFQDWMDEFCKNNGELEGPEYLEKSIQHMYQDWSFGKDGIRRRGCGACEDVGVAEYLVH